MNTIHIVLSLRIADLPIKKLDKVFFEKHGVVYLGEFFAFFKAYTLSTSKFKRAKAVDRIIEVLEELGYGPTASVLWIPPYFADLNNLFIALNTPTMEGFFIPEKGAHFHLRGQHCLGQVLRRMGGEAGEIGRRISFQSAVHGYYENMGIHAWMHIPPSWEAPKRVPECWRKYLREMAKLQEERQSEDPQVPQPPRFENLLRPLIELELSIRTGNLLKAARVHLVGDLVQHHPNTLTKSIRRGGWGFSRKSLREINDVLAEMKLTLDMPPEHPLIIQFEASKAEQNNPE